LRQVGGSRDPASDGYFCPECRRLRMPTGKRRPGRPRTLGRWLPRRIVPKRWGRYETLAWNEPCTVKVLRIYVGGGLSHQRHRFRDEFWRVASGVVVVRVGNRRRTMEVGDTAWIPRGTWHHASAIWHRGCGPFAEILEVSRGRFDEGDIERKV